MEEYRGRYSTKIGAKRALTKFGHDSVTAAFDEKFERVPYAFARFGDLVQMDTGEMGVKTNRGVWVISFTGGTENYPDPKTVITAWRV
ncbi:hypothetical protein JCM19235_1961 [Vibrio maritimus]|uniref:DUF6950 domain-containing protein n=1 Tax=Vibrio maritimus TaxID=990268 RepID=A0A090RVH2_9VIBR|nr:hypothetical protein JCM19235_1961 [Vibrio maritimus]